jgi:hypothetical protein
MTHTLADIINLAKVLTNKQFLLAVPVDKEQAVKIVHAQAVVLPSPWRTNLSEDLLDKQYHLCLPNWHRGSFKPVTQLFVPFDRENAPLNDNLLVYINGQIIWDNVRLAQQSKES